uniref:WGS project CBMI000000000 data, contig CS3069_c002380 n=1 Tax=Fusarium clavum TaxID=2594811 RepID=A0A090MCN8_9HYPO|nr:unnamed protein product [Fusarium clavum]
MEWYWNLVCLLLDVNRIDKFSAGLRDELEKHVTQLYKKLLLYQIKSVCLYNRNAAAVLLRDIIKLDDWDCQLKEIKDAENLVQRDSEQYNTEQVKLYLGNLTIAAGSQEKRLQEIYSAIQDQTKLQERRNQDAKDEQCLKDLHLTDPRDDKKRIEHTKGGLLKDAYLWILDHADFQQFRDDPQSRLLWIRGDPGKGKTMLLCGIIDELWKESANRLSYFFCQAAVPQLSNATAVLRGLIYLLIIQQPTLISHVRERYNVAGAKLFEGINVWASLTSILADMLRDPTLENVVLVVDALDECETNRLELLDFITKSSSTHAKWIVSSRNWLDIEKKLDNTTQKVTLPLESNEDSISKAVHSYIHHKVGQLASEKCYNENLQVAVQEYLISNANGTFLWVALVCEELANPKVRKRHTIVKLKSFPPGLDSLYERMMEGISASLDADFCKQILATASVVYRPVTLKEPASLIESLQEFDDDLDEIIGSCGSFLTLKEGVVSFVHQSAKDFLLKQSFEQILPAGIAHQHHVIFSRSLDILSRTLKRDMYRLQVPGFPIDQISRPDPDPLASVQYSCIYWVDHLCDSNSVQIKRHNEALRDGSVIHNFLREKYLFWLEALSLLRSISEGVMAMQKLDTLVRTKKGGLEKIIRDACRFILSYAGVVEIAPLQVYASGLVFSPACSIVRQLFKNEAPAWIISKPLMESDWSACLQTLEGHENMVSSVVFSADNRRLASGLGDKTIKIWDAATGACLQTLKGHENMVSSVVFSADNRRLALGSGDKIIKIWNAATGACL